MAFSSMTLWVPGAKSFTSRAIITAASSPVSPARSLGAGELVRLKNMNSRPFCGLEINPSAIATSNRSEAFEAISVGVWIKTVTASATAKSNLFLIALFRSLLFQMRVEPGEDAIEPVEKVLLFAKPMRLARVNDKVAFDPVAFQRSIKHLTLTQRVNRIL